MKCLKINLKGEDTISLINSNEHALTFVLSYKKSNQEEMCTVNVTGTDLSSNFSYRWLSQAIEPNDKVSISIVDTVKEQVTEPIQVLANEDNFVNDQKLKTYHHLKNELEIKGLI